MLGHIASTTSASDMRPRTINAVLLALAALLGLIVGGAVYLNYLGGTPTNAVGSSEQTSVDQGSKIFD
ncbi:hypothetical protein [Aliihoeflea sp. PC F10.4]